MQKESTDLVFRLNQDDRKLLVEAATAKRLMAYDRRMACMNRLMHQQLLPLVLLMSPLLAAAVIFSVKSGTGKEMPVPMAVRHFVESQDAAVIWLSVGIVSVVWWLLCWRHGRSLLERLQVPLYRCSHFTNAIRRRALSRVLSRTISRQMARLEGIHHVQLDEIAFRIRGPRSRRYATVPWKKVIRIVESARFYKIYTRASQRFGLAYVVVKQSDEMDGQAYQTGLQRLLLWSPVKPEPEPSGR